MNAERKRRAREIFADAIEKDNPQERTAFVAHACGTDGELRQLVEALLKAHEGAGDLPGQTMLASSEQIIGEHLGTIIGRYKLLEKIGEGGFGVVYMAEQKEPVHRKVALKIVKAGMDTKEVIARFEAERQALALMDHPNIAQVFDGGVTQTGRPYFVMELVRGISITDFCDQRDLSTDERLQLFVQVSHAVQHAHQKGIIHRDLKPSNILVTLVNGEPLPKIIDFGVAKALGQQLTDKTLFTGFLRMVGTPAYMSPEQVDLSGVDIDTRADIYALGVLLYELLTGVTPFDADTLRNAALDEVRRMIRETDPPKPSTRLHTMGDKLTEVAKHRQAEPAALGRLVRGDLDWIVMRCLEKDRRRRYETPGALVEDIQRHLDHQPVLASPPSAAYRTRKFIRRHRTGVALVASVAVALVAGLVASLVGFAEARLARDHALAAEVQAEQSRQRAEVARDRAVAAEQQTLLERNRAELIAAEAALDAGQSKLEASDSWGLLDMVNAFELAKHNPEFQKVVGRRWSTWHTLWSRRTIAEGSMFGTPSPDFFHFVSISGWPPANQSSEVRLYDALTETQAAAPIMHESTAVGCAFSPDGRLLATVTDQGMIHLWDRRTGKPIGPPYETGVTEFNQLLFSPNGRYLAAFSGGNMGPCSAKLALIRLYESHEQVQLLEHRYPVEGAQFSPDGELLAVLCVPDLQMWRTSDLTQAGPPLKANVGASVYEFSADGTRLAFIPSGKRGIGLADTKTMQVVRFLPKSASSVITAGFSHDGRRLATFDWDCNLELWKTESGDGPYAAYRTSVRDSGRFAFSPDDSLLAVGSVNGTVRVLRTSDGVIVHTLHTPRHPSPMFLSNGVLAAPAESRVHFWDLTASPLPGVALPDDFLAHELEFDRSGDFLAVGSEGELRLWTTGPSPKLERILPMPGRVVALTCLKEENEFAAFSDDGSFTKVEPLAGRTATVGNVGRGSRLAASLSPDGHKLALFNWDEFYLVDTRTGQDQSFGYEGGSLSVVFSPDSQRLARGTADWKVRLYDTSAPTNTSIGMLKEFEGWVEGVAYHPDGNLLAVCVMGNTLHLYDSGQDRNIGSVRTTSVQANLARFSADGSLLAVAGPLREGGHAIEIWHVDPQRGLFESGVCLRRDQPIWSVAFSPNNQTLIVGGLGSTRLWHLPPQPKNLEEVQSRTWNTFGFRMNEKGKRVYLDPSTNEVPEIRARLTQAPESSDTPLDAALELPPSEALTAVQQLADQHPGTTVYQKILGRLHAGLVSPTAEQGSWPEAIAQADEAIRLGNDDPYLHYQRALACLGANDEAGYRATCRAMAERYQSSSDPKVIQWVGWSAALAPGALEDYGEPVKRLQRAALRVGGKHSLAYRLYSGAVLVRAGRFAEAAAELEQVDRHLKTVGADVEFSPHYHKFLLAICHAHLGHEDTGRQWFDAAARDVRSLLQPEQEPADSSVSWNRRLTLELLQQEAQSLVNPETPDADTN